MPWGDIMDWADVVFQYDGTYNGFLCCVFESYSHQEFPIAFFDDEEFTTFYPVRQVHTVAEHSDRVRRGIEKVSANASRILRRTFFTCLEDKEAHLFRFIQKLYEDGPLFITNTSDPVFYPIHRALRHLSGELEKLRGFIRFSDYNGVLGAEIEPKNQVLPFLRHHFCARYANESFFIYDRSHREMLMYSKGISRIAKVDSLHLTAPGAEEIAYRRLWKHFFETISIRERYNPRCQDTFMPKRYRGTMTEFLPENYDVGLTSSEAVRADAQ